MTMVAKRFLFVCLGNICRSPFAEVLFAKLADQNGLAGMETQSAGLIALPGNVATNMARRAASEYDVDLSGHRAQPLSKDLAFWADTILVMEKSQSDAVIAHFPEAAGRVQLIRHYARYGAKDRAIADPYGLDYEAYRFCYVDIEDAVKGLIEHLKRIQRPE